MTFMLSVLSEASKSTLSTERDVTTGYEAVKNAKDALGLFLLLEKTHLGSQERAAQSAFQNWILFKMGELSHEEYMKQFRALTNHITAIYGDASHPGYVKIDRITRGLYLMGVDQQFFSLQIDKALDEPALSTDELMSRFQIFKVQHEHLLASSPTQYKGQALVSDATSKSDVPPVLPAKSVFHFRLGTWDPESSFCKFCWIRGFRKSDHSTKAAHDLKYPKKDRSGVPSALASATVPSPSLASALPVGAAVPSLASSAKEFAKNFEDAMVLYQSALRSSGQNVPSSTSDGSNPSAICSI